MLLDSWMADANVPAGSTGKSCTKLHMTTDYKKFSSHAEIKWYAKLYQLEK